MDIIHFQPPSEFTFETVMSVRSTLNRLLHANNHPLNIDLGLVSRWDSAGIALLVEIVKLCDKECRVLKIAGLTAGVYSLADFCGVKGILETVSLN